jgi:hypothetical protein
VNISGRRFKTIKGTMKQLLYYHKSPTITKEDLGISDISDKEVKTCCSLYTFLKPYIPSKEMADVIAAQLPMLLLANKIADATG